MSKKLKPKNIPRLSFLPTNHLSPGIDVSEIDLAASVLPLPPFKASRFTVAPNSSSPAESHDVHEMWIVIEGRGNLHYDQQKMPIYQDNFVYFEPNKTHQVTNDGSEKMVIFSIWWGD